MDFPIRRRTLSKKLRGAGIAAPAAGLSENGSGDNPSVRLIEGDAREFDGQADLVLTNPYAALPPCLLGLPTLIANFANRKERCEQYVQTDLHEIATWGRGSKCRIWVANVEPIKVDCSDLIEEEEIPGRGWFPLDLPLRLLEAYASPASIIIDPFMGRGTTGKAALMLGHRFIGVDRDPERVARAREYIGV